jgi:hypothetical protein
VPAIAQLAREINKAVNNVFGKLMALVNFIK